MKVQVEELSAVERKITVELPAELVDAQLSDQYKRLSKTAKVRGFRPGKIPKGLIRKMFRQDAEAAAGGELIQSNILAVFTEASVEPLTMPAVDRATLAEGQPFEFSLVVQVKPTIDHVDVSKLTAERNSTEPTDEEIAAEMETRREAGAELEPVEDRGADTGDTVTIDFSGCLVGETEPFEGGSGSDHDLEIGSGSLVPGFEDQLIGKKEGDEVKVEITFPEDYAEHLANKPAVFDVTVRAVRAKVLPDVDDEFAVDLGFDDLGGLKASVYDKIADAKREEEDGRLRQEVLAQLMTANPLELPEALVTNAAERLMRQLRMQFQMSGIPPEQLDGILGSQTEMMQGRAKELAHRDLLIDALVTQETIEVSDDDIDDRIGEMAERAGQPKPKVRAMLAQDGRIDDLRAEMQNEKAIRWLADTATSRQPDAVEPEVAEAAEATEVSSASDEETA